MSLGSILMGIIICPFVTGPGTRLMNYSLAIRSVSPGSTEIGSTFNTYVQEPPRQAGCIVIIFGLPSPRASRSRAVSPHECSGSIGYVTGLDPPGDNNLSV